MREDDNIDYDEVGVEALIERYELMHQKKQPCYFDVDEFEIIINHYFSSNNLSKAQQAISTALKYHPGSVEIKLKQAEAEIECSNANGALKQLESIEQLAFNLKAEIHILRARALIQLNELEQAKRSIDSLPDSSIENVEFLLQQIVEELIVASEYGYTSKLLMRIYKQIPANYQLLLDIAYCFEREGNVEEAIKYYELFLNENPFNMFAWHELGKLYQRLKKYEKAIVAFDFAATIDPSYTPAYSDKAAIFTELESYSQAIHVLEELAEVDPDNIAAKYSIGECYEKLGKYDLALPVYLNVIEADCFFANAYYGVSFILKEQGKLEESYSFIRKAVELEPENGEFHYGFGKLLIELGQKEAAISEFERAVELNNADVESWLLLSELHTDFDKTLFTLEQATIFAYTSPELNFRLAALYFLKADMDKCVEHFERGILSNAQLAEDFFTYCPEAYHEERIMTIYMNSKAKTRHDF